ncbi:MAG TPA: ATP-binding protein, partial [Desulfuromonadales bacterium]|nr:ATP-binding protein [Desulfuromonadales bacterium]
MKLKLDDLLNQVSCGEDSTRQFKADVRNADSLASEMAAFANSEGGTIYLGVADDGGTPGLDKTDVARICFPTKGSVPGSNAPCRNGHGSTSPMTGTA